MAAPTVLVVDDQRDTVALLEMLLRHEGFTVLTARSGEDALIQFETSQPDAIVLDLNLPNMPGWEVYQQIKAQRDVAIVVVTANVMLDASIREIVSDNDAFFIKPFDVTILPQTLRDLMARRAT
jgi:DNA-binding response OmpR family regulator